MKTKKGSNGDVQKAAANDKEVAKVPVTFTIADSSKIRSGFVKEFVDFVASHKAVTMEKLIGEFSGRSIGGKKITEERVRRYASWCVGNRVFKKAK